MRNIERRSIARTPVHPGLGFYAVRWGRHPHYKTATEEGREAFYQEVRRLVEHPAPRPVQGKTFRTNKPGIYLLRPATI